MVTINAKPAPVALDIAKTAVIVRCATADGSKLNAARRHVRFLSDYFSSSRSNNQPSRSPAVMYHASGVATLAR